VGAQSNVEGRLSKAPEPIYKEIEQKVHLSQGPKHVDETTWFLWEKREFVWVMSTARAALYKIQEGWGAIYRDQLIGSIKKARYSSLTGWQFITSNVHITAVWPTSKEI